MNYIIHMLIALQKNISWLAAFLKRRDLVFSFILGFILTLLVWRYLETCSTSKEVVQTTVPADVHPLKETIGAAADTVKDIEAVLCEYPFESKDTLLHAKKSVSEAQDNDSPLMSVP